MAEPITDAEIEELRRLWRASGAGPWRFASTYAGAGYLQLEVRRDPPSYATIASVTSAAHGELLLALREAVPRLVAARATEREDARYWRRVLGVEDGGRFPEIA